MVAEARARVGHVQEAGQPLVSPGGTGGLGLSPHDPQPSEHDEESATGLEAPAPVPPPHPGIERSGRRLPLLPCCSAVANRYRVRGGIRSDRLANPHRPALLSVERSLPPAVERAEAVLPSRIGHWGAPLIPASAPDSKPLIFVTVGMDHHPFDRLVRWVDAWLEAGGSERARCLVQSGTATPPRRAEWRDYLSHEELEAVMQQAAVVVCQGGPGTIASCRRLGLVPIVVPRRSTLREHVDGHQVTFARRTAALGHVRLPETEERFREL